MGKIEEIISKYEYRQYNLTNPKNRLKENRASETCETITKYLTFGSSTSQKKGRNNIDLKK